MLGVPASALLGPVDELLRADLLVERGDELAFRHDLLRDGVLESLAADELRRLRRQAADVLLAAGAPPLEVAARLLASAQPGDAVAISTLFSAAWAVAAADPGTAADLGREALALTVAGRPGAGRHRLGNVALAARRRSPAGGARADRRRAARGADADRGGPRPARDRRDVLALARRAGAIEPAALEIPGLTDALRAAHLARLVHNLIVAGRGEQADALVPEARAAAEAARDDAALFTLDLAAAARDSQLGRFAEAGRDVERAAARTVGRAEDARSRLADQWRAEALAFADDFDGAFAVTADGLRAAQRDGRVWTVRTWESWRGRLLLQSGQIADASAIFEGLLGGGDELELENLAEASAGFALGRVALHTGDARATRAAAAFAEHLRATAWPELQRHAAWLLALQASARGDDGAARDLLMDGVDDATPVLPTLALDVADEVRAVRIARAAGDDVLARRAVAVTAARAEHNPGVASMEGLHAHARALARDDPALLAAAVAALERSPRRLAFASALEDLGAAAVAAGDREAAIDAFGRALEILAAGGAVVAARRVRDRLHALGVRRRIARSPRPATGWDALTPSEAAVARMVADGLTNREAADALVVSPHTVSMHLRRAFVKLDINSRRDLAALVPDDAPQA